MLGQLIEQALYLHKDFKEIRGLDKNVQEIHLDKSAVLTLSRRLNPLNFFSSHLLAILGVVKVFAQIWKCESSSSTAAADGRSSQIWPIRTLCFLAPDLLDEHSLPWFQGTYQVREQIASFHPSSPNWRTQSSFSLVVCLSFGWLSLLLGWSSRQPPK